MNTKVKHQHVCNIDQLPAKFGRTLASAGLLIFGLLSFLNIYQG